MMSADFLYLLFQFIVALVAAWVFFRLGRKHERREHAAKQVATAAIQQSGKAESPDFRMIVADILVMVWKLRRKMDDPGVASITRPIERILGLAERNGFQLRTYKGATLLPGMRVQVLDAVAGPEGLVIEDLEPEILHGGALVRQGAVTVGNGK